MTRPDSIAAAVEDVLDLHRDRLALLAGIDRPKIGYLSIQTPEEILLAAGAVPFRLTGEFSTETDGASVYLGSNYCSYVLSCFGEGLAGVYGFADAVVFVDALTMLAEHFGIRTIAEFVQDEAAAKLLAELGISAFQGQFVGEARLRLGPGSTALEALGPVARDQWLIGPLAVAAT